MRHRPIASEGSGYDRPHRTSSRCKLRRRRQDQSPADPDTAAEKPVLAESFDAFGAGLGARDFGAPAGGPDFADLAIGTPQEKLGRVRDAGRIHVLYGGNAGLSTRGIQVWNEGQLGGQVRKLAGFG